MRTMHNAIRLPYDIRKKQMIFFCWLCVASEDVRNMTYSELMNISIFGVFVANRLVNMTWEYGKRV